MQDFPNIVMGTLFLLLWLVLVSLPGIGLTYLGWRFSRSLQPAWSQTLVRATLLAIALTPSIFGHAGPMPAIFVVIAASGRDRLVGIVPILFVWAVSILAIGVLANKRTSGNKSIE